jgi:ligand-binding SRPBCC domain-containing protein
VAVSAGATPLSPIGRLHRCRGKQKNETGQKALHLYNSSACVNNVLDRRLALTTEILTSAQTTVAFSFDPENRAMRLSTKITLPQTAEYVFDLFADAPNLQAITPESLRFQIITPQPIDMSAGTLIDYRLSLRSVPIRWRREISVWEPPYRFIDRQLRGPYQLWEHTHTFHRLDEGTLVCDDVHYRVPGGRMMHRIIMKPELKKIFEYRHRRLSEFLGGTQLVQPN